MICLIISFLLDLVLGELFFNSYQHLNMLFVNFSIISIPMSYVISLNKKSFLVLLIILGLLSDILFSSIFFINILFVILYCLFLSIFYKIKECTALNIFLVSVLGFFVYDFYLFLILNLSNYSDLLISDYYYKIYNSLIMNIIYILLLIILYKGRIFGFKKSKFF